MKSKHRKNPRTTQERHYTLGTIAAFLCCCGTEPRALPLYLTVSPQLKFVSLPKGVFAKMRLKLLTGMFAFGFSTFLPWAPVWSLAGVRSRRERNRVQGQGIVHWEHRVTAAASQLGCLLKDWVITYPAACFREASDSVSICMQVLNKNPYCMNSALIQFQKKPALCLRIHATMTLIS